MCLELGLDFHSAAPYISHVITSLANIMTQSFSAQWKGLFGVFMAASDVEIERVPIDLVRNSVAIANDRAPDNQHLHIGGALPPVTVGIF